MELLSRSILAGLSALFLVQSAQVKVTSAGFSPNYEVFLASSLDRSDTARPLLQLALTEAAIINVPPFIIKAPQSQIVGLGGNVTIWVTAGGTTNLNYQWRKNESPLSGQTSTALKLFGVTTNDAGNYDVIVSNAAGSVTSVVATLSVELFPDIQLRKAVLCSLTNQPAQVEISDLQSLTTLCARSRGITNLMGLQFATNLTILDVSHNQISDLTPLQDLVKLASLEIDQEQNGYVSSLAPLFRLTNLSCLVLGKIYLNDYSPLSMLTNLNSLSIHNGNVTDLSFLQRMMRLSTLALFENGVTNVSPLAGLTNLRSLDLRRNLLTAYTGPTNLVNLYLGDNSISNVPSLNALTQLQLLNLDNTRIQNLSPLAGLDVTPEKWTS